MGGEQVADQHRARELLVLGPGLGPQTLVHRVRDADVGVLVPPAALLALELQTKAIRRFAKISQSRIRPLLGPSLLLVESAY